MDYEPNGIQRNKKMALLQVWLTIPIVLLSCNEYKGKTNNHSIDKKVAAINPYKQIQAIPLPAGFERVQAGPGTFASYLRNIELKEQTTVYLFNGQPKHNQSAQYALLNISVGNSDLQQCADAVMRLRAEYLYNQKQFQQIIFKDNNNTLYAFDAPYTREHFNRYLARVFGMCGSASLSKQLRTVINFTDIEPGDVLIRGGFPGHAVIVMDVAVNNAGKKIYLLAQSYMPAQDIHVLKNPANENFSPWYEVNEENLIHTPEYTFIRRELMTW